MSGALFSDPRQAGTTATLVVVLFSALVVFSGLASFVINWKDVGNVSFKHSTMTTSEETKTEVIPLRIHRHGDGNHGGHGNHEELIENVQENVHGVRAASSAFVRSQYKICVVLCFIVTILSVFAITSWSATDGFFAGLCFVSFVVGAGAALSGAALARHMALLFCGPCVVTAQRRGMLPLYKAVVRVGISSALIVGGSSLLVLYLLLLVFDFFHQPRFDASIVPQQPPAVNGGAFFYEHSVALSTFASAFSLGAGLVVLFTRFGGSAFGASSSVAAAVEGIVTRDLRKADPRNPVSSAQLVGLVVGEVSGVGCDVVGTIGAVVAVTAALSAQCVLLGEEEARLVGRNGGWGFTAFPAAVMASGLVASAIAFVLATHVAPPWLVHHLGKSLALQQLASSIVFYPLVVGMAYALLPTRFTLVSMNGAVSERTRAHLVGCVVMGSVAAYMSGRFVEYYTTHGLAPVGLLTRYVATGSVPLKILHAAGIGAEATVMPALLVGVLVYLSASVCDFYGVSCAGLGMVATSLGTGAALSLFSAFAKLCGTLNSLAKSSDAHGSSHASFSGMVASGSSSTSMLYCVRACATAVLAYATIAAVLLRCPPAGTSGQPGGDVPRIGEGGDPLQRAAGDANQVGMFVLQPIVLLAAVVGATFPFTISSMCIQTATKVASSVVAESEVQLMRSPDLLESLVPTSTAPLSGILRHHNHGSKGGGGGDGHGHGHGHAVGLGHRLPDYTGCVLMCHHKILQEFLTPVLCVLMAPFLVGCFFGLHAVCAFLFGTALVTLPLCVYTATRGTSAESAAYAVRVAHFGSHGDLHGGTATLVPSPRSAHARLNAYDERAQKAAAMCEAGLSHIVHYVCPALSASLLFSSVSTLAFAAFFSRLNGGHGLLGMRQ